MTNGIIELSAQECLDLIKGGGVGRVAFCTSAGPQIYPVNFELHESSVVFRTAAYTGLGMTVPHQPVAFEVDNLHHETRTGWSVVVSGTARPVDDTDELVELRRSVQIQPWAAGSRPMHVRITAHKVTGRRVAGG